MNDLVKLVSTFVEPISMIMALVLMISLVRRSGRATINATLMMGVLFSAAVVLSMSDPIILGGSGVFFDMRALLIGTAVALLGPTVGTMTLLTGLAYRYSLGGDGMVAGIVGMLMAFGAGMIWRHSVLLTQWAGWKKSVALAMMISTQSFAIFLVPKELWSDLFTQLVPYIVVSNIAGCLLINHLISGELSFLSAAETSKIEANTDHLTGLLNRRGLNLLAPDMKASFSTSRWRALLYFDIDKFKATNDNFGHAVGDEVLKLVVNRVSDRLRQNDVFARLGGDEFAVILPEVDVKEAKIIAERCRAVVAEEGFIIGQKLLPISISVGAVWLRKPTELDKMLHSADEALYQAKSNGRNAVVFLSGIGKTHGAQSSSSTVVHA